MTFLKNTYNINFYTTTNSASLGERLEYGGTGKCSYTRKDYCHKNLIYKKEKKKLKFYRDGEDREREKTNKTKQQIAGNFTNQEKYLLREERTKFLTTDVYRLFSTQSKMLFKIIS